LHSPAARREGDAGGERTVQRVIFALVLTSISTAVARADNPGDTTSWRDLVSEGESLVFGRFVGKFESAEFSSRRVRVRNNESGHEILLSVDDGVGYIAETIPRDVRVSASRRSTFLGTPVQARQVSPHPAEVRGAAQDRGRERAFSSFLRTAGLHRNHRGGDRRRRVVYQGHQLRVYDDCDGLWTGSRFPPRLAQSLDRDRISRAA
jgi:hypothetical protein